MTSTEATELRGANACLGVVKQLLAQSQFIRRNCTPEEADEALEWEKKLVEREKEITRQQAVKSEGGSIAVVMNRGKKGAA